MTYRDRLLSCPRCGLELRRQHRRDAWRCAKCRGVLVGIAELIRQLHGVAPMPRRGGAGVEMRTRSPDRERVACAACASTMTPVVFHGVELDRCYDDELVWFDTVELERVLDAAIAEHDARRSWLDKLFDLLFAN